MKSFCIIGLIVALIVVVAWGTCFCFGYKNWGCSEIGLNNFGLFGDSFGIVNALFSGLALVGVVFAIFLQREDIKLQREDIQQSVCAQKEAAKAQQLQARVASLAGLLEAKKTIRGYVKARMKSSQHEIPTQEHTPMNGQLQLIEHQIAVIDSQLTKELVGMLPDSERNEQVKSWLQPE
jgi:uncharacterized membrane protein